MAGSNEDKTGFVGVALTEQRGTRPGTSVTEEHKPKPAESYNHASLRYVITPLLTKFPRFRVPFTKAEHFKFNL